MKHRMAVGLIVLLLLGSIFAGLLAAQGDVRLETLRVGLWPEYDRAALLVIYWGALPEDTTFPVTLRLRIPARVSAPHVVAAQSSPTAGVDEVGYESAVEGEWRAITFETNGPRFQFEYYDALPRAGDLRTPSYTWPGDYAVTSLRLELQHPPHGENLSTDPDLPEVARQEQDGLVYHSGEFGPLAAGDALTLNIQYTRSEEALTVDLLSALQPATDSSSTAANPVATTSAQSGGLRGEDLVLLVAVAVGSFLLGAASMRLAINWQDRRR